MLGWTAGGGRTCQRGPRAAWMISLTWSISYWLMSLCLRSSARTWRATAPHGGSGVFSAGRSRCSRRGWRSRRSGFRVRSGRGSGRATGLSSGVQSGVDVDCQAGARARGYGLLSCARLAVIAT